jgi:hypothetical protein
MPRRRHALPRGTFCLGMRLAPLAIVLVSLAPALAPASDEAAPLPERRPEIAFERKLHDFGRAVTGQELRTTFTFYNVGNETLVIERVVPG